MIGTVAGLYRYPVKSLLGEPITATEVTEQGLVHDRRFALLDTETGKVASAKHPRLWRRLLALTAELHDPAVQITAPDGTTWKSTDPDTDRHLSRFIGRGVVLTDTPPAEATLDRARPDELLDGSVDVGIDVGRIGAAAPAGTFVDFAPVHLFTTATLARIDSLAPGTAEIIRYRPNIVIDTPGSGFPENDWPGRTLRIGHDLTLHVIARTPRCAIPTLAHGTVPADSSALRALADHNRIVPLDTMAPQPCAGAYAQVTTPGRIKLGDSVHWN